MSQSYDAIIKVTSFVSVPVNATSEEEAERLAKMRFNNLTIDDVKMKFVDLQEPEKSVNPKTLDFDIDVQTVNES